MSERVTRSEGEPHDRLTRIADAMIAVLEEHPEHHDGDRALIFLDNEEERRGGLGHAGYDEDTDAIVNLLGHLKAMLEARGQTLMVTSIGGDE